MGFTRDVNTERVFFFGPKRISAFAVLFNMRVLAFLGLQAHLVRTDERVPYVILPESIGTCKAR